MACRSPSACVGGVALDPHDVDIMVDHCDAVRVAEVFADVTVEPLVDTGGWLTRDFGVLFWHGRVALLQAHPAGPGSADAALGQPRRSS